MNIQFCLKSYLIDNKYSLIIRILLVLFVLYSIYTLSFVYPFGVKSIFISSTVAIVLALFGNSFVFSVYFFFIFLLCLVESHFLRVYGFSFELISKQIVAVCFDTNKDEIFSYLKIISIKEFLLLGIAILLSVLVFFTHPLIINISIFFRHFKKYKINSSVCFIVSLMIAIAGIFMGMPKVYVNFIQQISISDSQSQLRAQNLKQKKQFKWHSVSSNNSPKNVIIVIGESHRRDYFYQSWNRLARLDNEYDFSNMISQYSYTLRALPQIISRKPFNYPVDEFYESSLFKLYEEAGYTTHYICYLPVNWVGDGAINYFVSETQNYYHYGNISSLKSNMNVDDMEVLPIIKKIVANNSKNFIVVKLIGVHYNFEDRYYKEDDNIRPSLKDNQVETNAENKQIYINTYINAMNYSTKVIHSIFEYIDTLKSPTIICFLSDHGFNIFDDGNWNIGSSKKAFEIPFIIKANNSYLKERNLAKWNNLGKHISDALISNDVFETIVSLSEIKRPMIYNHDLTSEKLRSSKREVLLPGDKVEFEEDLKH